MGKPNINPPSKKAHNTILEHFRNHSIDAINNGEPMHIKNNTLTYHMEPFAGVTVIIPKSNRGFILKSPNKNLTMQMYSITHTKYGSISDLIRL